jgi:hypothetical protein
MLSATYWADVIKIKSGTVFLGLEAKDISVANRDILVSL